MDAAPVSRLPVAPLVSSAILSALFVMGQQPGAQLMLEVHWVASSGPPKRSTSDSYISVERCVSKMVIACLAFERRAVMASRSPQIRCFYSAAPAKLQDLCRMEVWLADNFLQKTEKTAPIAFRTDHSSRCGVLCWLNEGDQRTKGAAK
jgi:hypothetical protein